MEEPTVKLLIDIVEKISLEFRQEMQGYVNGIMEEIERLRDKQERLEERLWDHEHPVRSRSAVDD